MSIGLFNKYKYLDSIDAIYWINLKRSTDRKKHMEEILKNINIQNTRIDAIDEKNIDLSKYVYNLDYKRGSKYEYACLLSHLKAIKTFLESNNNIALILEDDITLEFSNFWDKSISTVIKGAPPNWDILMLSYTQLFPVKNLYSKYNVDKNRITGAISYLINKKGARKLLNSIDIINQKYYFEDDLEPKSDVYIYAKLNTYCYKYPYFTYRTNNTSTIHDSHLTYHLLAKRVLVRLWKDYHSSKYYSWFNWIKHNT